MSKYVIIEKLDKEFNPYTDGKNIKPLYSILFHTKTKYQDNRPYFSSMITKISIKKYSFEKDKIDIFMKIAIKIKSKHKGTKLFILKQNSPKLKELMLH